jgi:hypothetical protein
MYKTWKDYYGKESWKKEKELGKRKNLYLANDPDLIRGLYNNFWRALVFFYDANYLYSLTQIVDLW